MLEVKLKPLDGDGDSPVDIEEAKTVIGRGPLLQVTDKRVSRNHALLEIKKGKLYLTPTHTNPCFFKKDGEGEREILTKGESFQLENGDVFGLLPDSLYYKVILPGAQNGAPKGDERAKSSSPVKEGSKESDDEDTYDSVEKKAQKTESHSTSVQPPGKKEMALPTDKSRKLPNWLVQLAKSPPPPGKSPPKPVEKQVPQVASKPKKLKLSESEEEEEVPPIKPKRAEASKAKGTVQRRSDSDEESEFSAEDSKPKKMARQLKAKKKSSSEEWDNEPEEEERPRKALGRSKAKLKSDDDWEEEEENSKPRRTVAAKKGRQKKPESEDDWSEEDIKPKRGGRGTGSRRARRDESDDDEKPSTSRPTRAARQKRASYVDDFMGGSDFSDDDLKAQKDDSGGDSDYIVDQEEESASDWEANQGSQKRKGKGRIASSKKVPTKKGKRKRGWDDDDDEEEEEEEYVPRPSKRRAAAVAAKKGRFKEVSSDEESESDQSDEPVTPVKKAKKKNDSPPIRPKPMAEKKHRQRCRFGDKCYRKNPTHREEFCHPGDESFEENSEDEGLPDCPFGETCYRTNPKHLQEFRHPQPYKKKVDTEDDKDDKESKKIRGKKSLMAEDDDSAINTYDYEDSFIDDNAGKGGSESGSHYSDEEEEDLSNLRKEAKQFGKNEKMAQKVK